MKNLPTYDVAIIGAGAVGCAFARELSSSGCRVLVLEKNQNPGQENSRNNSGVIHSGIHMNPQKVPEKARLCRIGSQKVIEYCQQNTVTYRQPGMYIVVARKHSWGLQDQLSSLWQLWKNSRSQKIRVQVLTGKTIASNQPEISAVFGIRIPNVAVIDVDQFVGKLLADAHDQKVDFVYETTVIGLARLSTLQTEIETTNGIYRANIVINAAGLYADQVARVGEYGQYRHFFYRGEYWEVDPSSGIRVSALVYPVKRKKSPGLGIHITPNCYGQLFLGPNAVKVDCPDDYSADLASAEMFHEDVQAFLPRLRPEHLKQTKHPGIRPKLTDGKTEDDFCFGYDWFDSSRPAMLNLIGIESPGLTASLAMAEFLGRKVTNYLNISQPP